MWRYVARQVVKDTHKNLRDILETYLPRVIEKQVEEAMEGESMLG